MRYIITLLFIGFCLTGVSQAPKLINYQGIARDTYGNPLTLSNIGLKFTIKQGSSTVFTEIQTVATNSLGLFSTQIGSTSNLSIDWQSGNYALQVAIDANSSGNYTDIGPAQSLASVPYALHAASVPASYANNVLTVGTTTIAMPTSPTPTIAGAGIATVTSGSASNYIVTVPAPSLAISSNSISVSGGNSIILPAALPAASVTGSGLAQVSSSGTNSFNVSVAAQTLALNSASTQLSISNGNSVTLPAAFPQASVTANSGVAIITSPGTNTFNINVPAPTLSISTNTLSIVGSNSVLLPAVTVPTVTGTGIATSASSAYNYSVNVPMPTYNGSALIFGAAANSVAIAPTLSISGSVLSAGVSSNSVNLSMTGPFKELTAGTVSLTTTTDNLSLGTPGLPTAKLDVRGTTTGSAVIRAINANSSNTSPAVDVATDGSQGLTVTNTNASGAGGSFYVQDGQALSAQNNGNTSNTFYAYNTSTAVGTFAGYFKGGFVTESKSASSAHFSLKAQSTGSVDLFVVRGDGNVGINTNTPSQKLDVAGSVRINDGTQADGKVLVSDASGKGSWKSSPAAISFGNLNQSSIIATSVPAPLATGTYTFTKQSASSEVDVALYSRIYAGIFSGSVTAVYFDLYIDGAASSSASSRYVITGSGSTEYVTLRSVFPGLSSGTHTITVVATADNSSGSASGVVADPGGLGGKIIVKEIY